MTSIELLQASNAAKALIKHPKATDYDKMVLAKALIQLAHVHHDNNQSARS